MFFTATGVEHQEPGTDPASNITNPSPNQTIIEGNTWEARINVTGSKCYSGGETGITNVNHSEINYEDKVKFQGSIKTSNPCHKLEPEVIPQFGQDEYTLNIKTVPSNKTCSQCQGIVKYNASFTNQAPFELDVKHNGNHKERLETPVNPLKLIERIINFFLKIIPAILTG